MSEVIQQPVTPTPAPSAPAPVAPVSTPAPEAPAVKPAEAAPAAPATQGDKPAAPVDKPVEGEKPAEPPAKVVPEKYELKLSENSLGDAALIERVADYAKSQGLSQDEAAALLVDQEKMVSTLVENQKQGWLKQAQVDPEIGGEKLGETSELSRRALETFDTDGKLRKELERFGYGNHPEVLRFTAKIGRMISEDKSVRGGFAPIGEKKSTAEILYGGAGQK